MAETEANKFELQSMRVQNLKGFEDARLRLDQDELFLVGPNNAGKTSLLRLLGVVFNWDLTDEYRRVSDALLDELLPARDTRNAARRLSMRIKVADGRTRRRLPCDKDETVLFRLSLTVSDRRLRANLGPPSRNEQRDVNAERLIDQLRDEFDFVHVPAGRSVDSPGFQETLVSAMTESLQGTLQKPGKGATKAERAAQKVVESLEKTAGPVEDFWTEFLGRMPDGWISEGVTTSQIDRSVLARFIVDQLAMRVSTGDHDASGVPAVEVGSGLQSLLDIELRRLVAEASDKKLVLAVEEPEVFLHPSAQRRLGRSLASGELASKTLVSTHSHLVVEEANFDQLAIVREHVVSQPEGVDETRSAINSALLAGRGAEVLFARSVLLVEGPGDREYFEALRRRLARLDGRGAVDHCYVLDIGANSRFAPSIRLLRSYQGAPFAWTALMDSDSVSELRQAMTNSSLRLSSTQQDCLTKIEAAVLAKDLSDCEQLCMKLAKDSSGQPVFLAPGDLENVMCSSLTDVTAGRIGDALDLGSISAELLSERLGTKHRRSGKAIDGARKYPWMRGTIGRMTPEGEVSEFVLAVLTSWVAGASSASRAKALVKSFAATR